MVTSSARVASADGLSLVLKAIGVDVVSGSATGLVSGSTPGLVSGSATGLVSGSARGLVSGSARGLVSGSYLTDVDDTDVVGRVLTAVDVTFSVVVVVGGVVRRTAE